MKFILFFLLAFGQDLAAGAKANRCETGMRAVIDMGSGTTKLNMAEVETCEDQARMVRPIGEADRPVALEASKNTKGEISLKAQQEAVAVLRELQTQARHAARENNFKEFQLAVVGTHAVRTAKNRAEFLKRVKDAGFSLRALTQDEEAQAGFAAVAASKLPAGCNKDSLLVWDVGGGSTQFVRANKNQPDIVKFDLGAESFREKITAKFKPLTAAGCPRADASPNPVGKETFAAARGLVAKLARVKSGKLKPEGACLVGIGGVHTKAVEAQLQKNWRQIAACACTGIAGCKPTEGGYNKKELECLGGNFATKSDCDDEIKGPYSTTSVSNLAMILGFMDQLGADRVHTLPLNMGHHFVLDNERLEFKTVKAQ